MNSTILYYSSNTQNENFESKIRETILKSCDVLPIISVTQKPIDFGNNICVGEVGSSEFNMLRQILIGCEEAKTKYIISCEADCLYPPEYFKFIPPIDDACYRNTNTYIIGRRRNYYWRKKEGGTWAQVINREFYIKRLQFLLQDEPFWDGRKRSFVKEKGLKLFDSYEYFTTEFPCVSFKARGNMHNYSHSERQPIYYLPYWGDSKELVKEYDYK